MATYAEPPPFNPASDDWDMYMLRFEVFLEANDLGGVSEHRKKNLFLGCCGPEVLETAKNLSEPMPLRDISWSALQQMLKSHYAPKPLKHVCRYQFQMRNQEEGESIDEYVAALRKAAAHCEFDELDDQILHRILLGVRDQNLQPRLLARPDLSLQIALDEARASELVKSMETLQCHNKPRSLSCASCGGDHIRSSCRFCDVICQRCERKGHIAKVCRSEFPITTGKPKKMGKGSSRGQRPKPEVGQR